VRHRIGWILVLVSTGALAATPASDLPKLTPAEHRYFVHHSLGFHDTFMPYHPGPRWDLQHAQALHLTKAQILALRRQVIGMVQDTKAALRRVHTAQAHYLAQAHQPDPSIRTIRADFAALGLAEAAAASAMMEHHLEAYRLLDPAQQKRYQQLAKDMREQH
jgi:Spy/CpxP family protein refolding chaperone